MQINKDPEVIGAMFNSIASRYDRVNRILSLGLDQLWRKELAKNLPQKPALEVIDLASGTCDQLLAILKKHPQIQRAVAVDIAREMLALGKQKVPEQAPVEWCVGSALDVPYKSDSFDIASISFGIRNVPSSIECLHEMYRLLKVGGMALILEFSLPQNRVLKTLHLFYLQHILPTLGGLLTGKRESYSYLNKTIETFPYGEAFCELMSRTGFINIESRPLTGGVATLYIGIK